MWSTSLTCPAIDMMSADAVAEEQITFDDIERDLRAAAAERLRDREERWEFERRQGLIADQLLAAAKDLHEAHPGRRRVDRRRQLVPGPAPHARLGRRQPRPPLPGPRRHRPLAPGRLFSHHLRRRDSAAGRRPCVRALWPTGTHRAGLWPPGPERTRARGPQGQYGHGPVAPRAITPWVASPPVFDQACSSAGADFGRSQTRPRPRAAIAATTATLTVIACPAPCSIRWLK